MLEAMTDADKPVSRTDLVDSFNKLLRVLDARLKEDPAILNDEHCTTAAIVTELFHDIEDATIDLRESY